MIKSHYACVHVQQYSETSSLLRPTLHGPAARHLRRMDVDVAWFRHGGTDLDAVQPFVLEYLIDEDTRRRFGLEHLSQQWATGAGGEIVDSRGAVYLICAPALRGGDVGGVEWVGQLSYSPGQLLEVKTVVDNATRPNIDEAGIIV